MKHNYQVPALRVITIPSRPLLNGGSQTSPTATFMNNPSIGDGEENPGEQ